MRLLVVAKKLYWFTRCKARIAARWFFFVSWLLIFRPLLLHLLYHELCPSIHRAAFVCIVVAYGFGFTIALIGEALGFYSAVHEVLHDFERALGGKGFVGIVVATAVGVA